MRIPSFPFHFRTIPSFIFHHFRFIFPEYSVIRISSFPFHLRIIPSFVFHHFRFISGVFRRSYVIISVSFPEYSVVHISSFPFHFRIIPSFIFHHFRFISGVFRRPPSASFLIWGLFSLETETQQYVLLGIIHYYTSEDPKQQ